MSNILPYQQKRHVHRLRVLRLAAATLWSLAFLAFAGILLLIPSLVMVNSHYTITEREISRLEQTGAVANPVDIAALEKRVEALAAKLAVPVAPSPTSYIDAIRAVPAPGIALSGYAMEERKTPALEIAGTAATREALQRFVAALEQAEGVSGVDSPVSNYVKSTNSTFQITVSFATP